MSRKRALSPLELAERRKAFLRACIRLSEDLLASEAPLPAYLALPRDQWVCVSSYLIQALHRSLQGMLQTLPLAEALDRYERADHTRRGGAPDPASAEEAFRCAAEAVCRAATPFGASGGEALLYLPLLFTLRSRLLVLHASGAVAAALPDPSRRCA